MSGGVYILCAGTSLICAFLLWRGYRRQGRRLLLWSALCFAALTIDNVILYVDVEIMPSVDLSLERNLAGLVGLMVLVYGLVWESD